MQKEQEERIKSIVEILTGRRAKKIITFEPGSDFEAYYAAEEEAKALGYDVGSMEGRDPIALAAAPCSISKWSGLRAAEKKLVDGLLLSDDFRSERVYLVVINEVKSDG